MINEQQACKTPLDDLEQAALAHYEELASAAHQWSSCIPQAIRFYFNEQRRAEQADKRKQTMEPTLSLLVIDLGDSVVVKVESGRLNIGLPSAQNNTVHSDGVTVFKCSFPELRQAIDGEKRYPRIELSSNIGEGPQTYRLYLQPNERLVGPERSIVLDSADYDALSQLAGKPLPIWEGGKWERLLASESKIGTDIGGDVSIWRYTR